MTERKEINGEKVPIDEKIFSIYERHTDIIVKGARDVEFGHKVVLTDCKSGLILDCEVLKGNPNDTTLFIPALQRVASEYGVIPKNVVADGGFASLANQKMAKEKGLVNIVFNKVTRNMRNLVSSKKMETQLKKWRSGIEAVISNYKRSFDMFVCTWKGKVHFDAKVLWSAIAYNIRVMTRLVVSKIVLL